MRKEGLQKRSSPEEERPWSLTSHTALSNSWNRAEPEVGDEYMRYYFSKNLKMTFDEAVARVMDELKKEGFGILTDIDVQKTLKSKLNADFRKYRILGACNPPFAYKALLAEDKIGVMLPCNVIVQDMEGGMVEVAAIDPIASMQSIENTSLKEVAVQIQAKLSKVIENL
jgi:uncharacterized protein (DUF302 family)